MKIRPVEADLFHADRRTDRHDEGNSKATVWGQGESAGQYRGHRVTERGHWFPEVGSSYSPGAVDADYSLSPPKTVRAW